MAAKKYCPRCGAVAKEKTVYRGSFWNEFSLWLLLIVAAFYFSWGFLIVPGILYSVWRLSTRQRVCPSCGAPNMIPLDSPLARQAGAS
jgi:ribosomal protein S27AE